MRIRNWDAGDDAVVLPTIAKVPAERHIKRAREQRQGATLILVARDKVLLCRCEAIHDIDRPPRQQ